MKGKINLPENNMLNVKKIGTFSVEQIETRLALLAAFYSIYSFYSTIVYLNIFSATYHGLCR